VVTAKHQTAVPFRTHFSSDSYVPAVLTLDQLIINPSGHATAILKAAMSDDPKKPSRLVTTVKRKRKPGTPSRSLPGFQDALKYFRSRLIKACGPDASIEECHDGIRVRVPGAPDLAFRVEEISRENVETIMRTIERRKAATKPPRRKPASRF
jgi:hypothetical protein